MANQVVPRPARRQFALSGLALGAAALAPRGALAQQPNANAAPAGPAQASGPIVLHGVSPRLTVHALDIFHGAAATGLRIDFSRLEGDHYKLLRSVVVNANGRSDDPLLIDESYQAGDYELLLHVDDYFAGKQAGCPRRRSLPSCRCASASSTSPSASTCRSSSARGATPIRAAAEHAFVLFAHSIQSHSRKETT